jgi:hypothetical protein
MKDSLVEEIKKLDEKLFSSPSVVPLDDDFCSDEEVLAKYIVSCALYGPCSLKNSPAGFPKSIKDCCKDKITHGQWKQLVYEAHPIIVNKFKSVLVNKKLWPETA